MEIRVLESDQMPLFDAPASPRRAFILDLDKDDVVEVKGVRMSVPMYNPAHRFLLSLLDFEDKVPVVITKPRLTIVVQKSHDGISTAKIGAYLMEG